MKTAMQELIEFATLSSMQYPIGEIVAKAHQLLEKEKEQIIKAYWGGLEGFMNTYEPKQEGDQWPNVKQSGGGAEYYYNETFKP